MIRDVGMGMGLVLLFALSACGTAGSTAALDGLRQTATVPGAVAEETIRSLFQITDREYVRTAIPGDRPGYTYAARDPGRPVQLVSVDNRPHRTTSYNRQQLIQLELSAPACLTAQAAEARTGIEPEDRRALPGAAGRMRGFIPKASGKKFELPHGLLLMAADGPCSRELTLRKLWDE